MNVKESLANALAPLCSVSPTELEDWFEVPKKADMGDLAFPCFRLAKVLRKAPPVIAAALKEQLVLPDGIAKAEAVGG